MQLPAGKPLLPKVTKPNCHQFYRLQKDKPLREDFQFAWGTWIMPKSRVTKWRHGNLRPEFPGKVSVKLIEK